MKLIDFIKKLNPELEREILLSNMNISISRFINYSIMISVVMAMSFSVVVLLVTNNLIYFLAFFFAIYICFFVALLRLPGYNYRQLGKKSESNVAMIGRRLLIQLESGKSLVNAIIDVSKVNDLSNPILQSLSSQIYMGKPLEEAIDEAIKNSYSPTFRKIFIQLRNSLKTGTDIKHTLKVVLEEITREKIIEFEEFGKKLNPVSLFYLIFGTIGPSLGIVVFVIGLSFLGITINPGALSLFIFIILAIQFLFIGVFSKMRPELDI
ncbi:type II secretion system F family protein [Candidatus Woesearchaeota archaeon]|nr:type II secretion system F family protein [Candidatus Woesearchaeota archaeon]